MNDVVLAWIETIAGIVLLGFIGAYLGKVTKNQLFGASILSALIWIWINHTDWRSLFLNLMAYAFIFIIATFFVPDVEKNK